MLLLALLLGLSSTGYQRTRWGMTPAQVKALYPESMDAAQARKLKPGAFVRYPGIARAGGSNRT